MASSSLPPPRIGGAGKAGARTEDVHRIAEIDGPGVQSASNHRALDARNRRQPNQIINARNATRREDRKPDRGSQRGSVVDIRAALEAVARDVGVEQRGGARAARTLSDVDDALAARLRPALHRDLRSAAVDGDDDVIGM